MFTEEYTSNRHSTPNPDPLLAMYPNGQYILAPQLAALAQAQAAYANLLLGSKQLTIVNNPPNA